MLTVRLRPELVALLRAFPRAAREGTSPGFCRVRVSVFALTSLSTSDWLLSSVNALQIDFPHYPIIDLDVNEEKWNQRLGIRKKGGKCSLTTLENTL